MTGFSHILETQRAFELGAAAFLSKPFQEDDIVELINKILNSEQKKLKKLAKMTSIVKFQLTIL